MGAPRLRRVVVRVPEELLGELATIKARLSTETGLDYSQGAVVRGLLSFGVAVLSGREHLAPSFVGMRVKRGRKRGNRRSALDVALDLGADDDGKGGRA